MKNIILVSGVVLVLINTVSGFILQDYVTHKMLFGNLSIVLTTALIYLAYKFQTSGGFKIGYILIFGISGFIRFICAILSGQEFKNNFALLLFIIIFCVECILLFVSHVMKNK